MVWTRTFESTKSSMFYGSFTYIEANKSIVIASTVCLTGQEPQKPLTLALPLTLPHPLFNKVQKYSG